jgi:NAD(P)-dependent dehydrogenase (short-subunit alcohol dehydrogenase family)
MSQLRVMITGGGRGIGRATALRFARAGAKVVVAARTSSQLDAVVAEIGALGGEGLAAQMNVADHGSVEAAVFRSITFTGGGLDVLVNCARVIQPKPFGETDVTNWRLQLEVNLYGPFFVTLESLDALGESERAHVFNVCAPEARAAGPSQLAYSASQQGLRGFSSALGLDFASQGIRVTTVFSPAKGALPDPAETVAEAIFKAYQAGTAGEVDVTG